MPLAPYTWHLKPILSPRRSGLFLPNEGVLSVYSTTFCKHHIQSVQQIGDNVIV
jgi:hypothetical protein